MICLTGDEHGPLAHALKSEKGNECVERLIGIFGKQNVYAEVQRHFTREEEVRNQEVIRLARSHGLPLLATNGVSYAEPKTRELQDVLGTVSRPVRSFPC